MGNGGGRERVGLESEKEPGGPQPFSPSAPARREASPGIQGSQRGLVHLSHQRGPVTESTLWSLEGPGAKEDGVSPQRPLPRLPVGDTYSRAGGSLSSSFSVFASRTLWGESKGLRVGRGAAASGRGQSRCVISRGSKGTGTTGRYLQQHQGAQAHLALRPCQALPVGKESESTGLTWETRPPGSFRFTPSDTF